MHRPRFISLVILLWMAACAPAATQAPLPTSTPLPTATTIVAENPPACATANMFYHPPLAEVLMTGCTPTSGDRSDVNVIWGWNGERWHRVAEGGPAMRVLGGAAYDEGRNMVVLYGGYSLEESSCAHETWEWDGESWTRKDTAGPTACDHLEMVYDASQGKIILYGGGDEDQNLVADTWAWDGEAWTRLTEEGPPGRAHFGFVYDDAHTQILLYGGYGDQIMDDFWSWRDGKWQEINFPGPGPLSHAGMALDGDGLLVFGGASSTSTFSSLSDRTWKLTNGRWSELELAEHPSQRGSPAIAYDPGRERVVLYGGFASDRSELNDTWEWDGAQWQCVLNCQ